jgi:hypothetical protein
MAASDRAGRGVITADELEGYVGACYAHREPMRGRVSAGHVQASFDASICKN